MPHTQSTPRERLLQERLFGEVEQKIGPLSEKARLLLAVVGLVPLGRCLPPTRGWRGHPAEHRMALATAFLAKAVYGVSTTRQLIYRLKAEPQLRAICGWNCAEQLPHESTFSRVFEEFAFSELPQRLHEAVIECTQRGRIVGHIACDLSLRSDGLGV